MTQDTLPANGDYLCVGICLPDDDGAYCIGCGRPWEMTDKGTATPEPPPVPPAPTFMAHGSLAHPQA